MWAEIKTIVDLNLKGYQDQYIVKRDCAICVRTFKYFPLTDFGVDQVHNFRTGFFYNECLDLYAVANEANGIKGILTCIYSKPLENDKQLKPSEFIIDKTYRFEGNSDPDDNMIVYAISSQKYDLKAILVNAYGIYAEQSSDELIAKLEIKR